MVTFGIRGVLGKETQSIFPYLFVLFVLGMNVLLAIHEEKAKGDNFSYY